MAEPDDDDTSWRAGCIGCSGTLLLFIAVVFVVVSLDERGFDPDRHCPPEVSGSCISVETGFVESTNGFFDRVTVRYDDGRQKTTVTMKEGDGPPPGSRVRLEWWEGDIVALYELEHERRFRTTYWPDPRWIYAVAFGVLAAAVGLALGAVFGIAALVARGRARYAGISNGKPWRLRRRSKSRR